MSIVFRIATAADDRDGPTATINARQLAAFRSLLRSEVGRDGRSHRDRTIRPAAVEGDAPVSELRLVEDGDHIRREVEDARHAGESQRADAGLEAVGERPLLVIVGIDQREAEPASLGVEMDLATGNAYALLESLGLRPDSVGEMPVDELRKRFENPAVRRRMREQNVDHYADRLARLIATADTDDSSRFEWA
ncbi:hypothetical protein Q4610_17730 [Sphingobium sp. HBC34]|uniref:Uncharacterized protein n=1 Tax=Sphingobium cyanobacteriorum TaxID=3063954 RepID=A0ABT8ZT17_9SPHN|nr:hypothetical protein [Sphingobium sp. HBC34]MDO7836890.1 hypothetical protein [Sphingobium sp. HBC34]